MEKTVKQTIEYENYKKESINNISTSINVSNSRVFKL